MKKTEISENQEASGLLNNCAKIWLLQDILLQRHIINEINEIDKFLLTGDKIMTEMHLKKSGFTYSASVPFTKSKEKIKKIKETGDSRYTYKERKNFMPPFYGQGSTASRLVPFRGGSLLFTAKFPVIPGTHFINLGRMKG